MTAKTILDEEIVHTAPSFVYPNYTFEERFADGVVHAVGVIGSIIAFWILFSQAAIDKNITPWLTVYAMCVIALFCFSAAYHMTPWPQYRPVLRRFDQSAIYFKIAGTYTPLVFIVGTTFSYSLLAAIWVAAALGAGVKLLTGDKLDRHTVMIYLVLGWSSVLLIWPLYNNLPTADIALVLLGGALYTVGVYFHQSTTIKFSVAIWHSFVLAASACHFIAIADAATRQF
ncbi:MAG: hemolysin III family protein [Ahrensia sp.]|nr:hemolysin III family protein [Ahrensia sp.]